MRSVGAAHEEVVPGQVDGQWFLREIRKQNGVAAIELVYCPLVAEGPQAGSPPVCRTAIVWEAGYSELTDTRSGGSRAPDAEPAPTPAPSAPPPTEPAPPAPPGPPGPGQETPPR
jgi:hypothetical protein